MHRRLPPLNALKAFEAAARHLSFTRAADELFVTQAAVSHQIKALEEFLSLKLFIRRNRTLLLTEEGQAYFLELKDIFKNLQDATERLLARGSKGAITVATPPSFASQWLVPRISKFSLAYPDIDVRLKAVDFDEGFLADDIDVAIYYGRGRWSGIQAEKLHTEFLTPLCSPSLFQGSKPLNSLADLKHHVLLHDSSRAIWKMWLKHFNVYGVNVNQGPVFSHSMMVMQAAALGQGIALGNSVLAKPELDAGRLIMPFEEKLESRDAYYLVCHEGQAEMGKIAAFRDWVMNLVQEEQAYV
ncbi:LysR family transcriptional regulator, glycine cleavage system transcriptional activator [Marisediminitalea aggregata]|uniref:LysR family transcriptional regulator, glycine cleavage system transcriptional activator n=1 Tax=Marisediminitalea aggregata TaxID=634436 RepID=A0A1M5JS55_9ALTE|nr:transcriptional regulator GcvA [Marisediminitalea aggregata]MBL54441.1 transcriptional regulator GcvA [Alteromonadaceae bacterium]MCP4236616.1 transcriptional regulator GcvA [Aestuariibacter sp.]MEC7823453.1 transcriptional regulator GcvA [Pseudomonadota bacterium]BBO27171.1 transcriptional regulator GcvA [Alteromonas sp. I4]MCP5012732.1 transcriptional regulator GcvA [Aestuariibacter sp.]|tara:strand:- start:2423 stop:3322 length:900 start_codon:yes stop_codon:yes gene_type:complete